MKICVVIPTYNEEKSIGGLVKQIRQLNLEVVVVDDGSTDHTSEIAKENQAAVIRNPKNEGKGASLAKGFSYALTNGCEAVITIDGDGQHLPSDIPYFIRLAESSGSAILIGNRMSKTQNMPAARLFTNKFMSWFLSKATKQKIPDTQCGFRLIKKEVLEKISLNTAKFEAESELLIKACRLGLKVESVPITTVYKDEKSQINPFIDTLRFIRFIFKEIWMRKSST